MDEPTGIKPCRPPQQSTEQTLCTRTGTKMVEEELSWDDLMQLQAKYDSSRDPSYMQEKRIVQRLHFWLAAAPKHVFGLVLNGSFSDSKVGAFCLRFFRQSFVQQDSTKKSEGECCILPLGLEVFLLRAFMSMKRDNRIKSCSIVTLLDAGVTIPQISIQVQNSEVYLTGRVPSRTPSQSSPTYHRRTLTSLECAFIVLNQEFATNTSLSVLEEFEVSLSPDFTIFAGSEHRLKMATTKMCFYFQQGLLNHLKDLFADYFRESHRENTIQRDFLFIESILKQVTTDIPKTRVFTRMIRDCRQKFASEQLNAQQAAGIMVDKLQMCQISWDSFLERKRNDPEVKTAKKYMEGRLTLGQTVYPVIRRDITSDAAQSTTHNCAFTASLRGLDDYTTFRMDKFVVIIERVSGLVRFCAPDERQTRLFKLKTIGSSFKLSIHTSSVSSFIAAVHLCPEDGEAHIALYHFSFRDPFIHLDIFSFETMFVSNGKANSEMAVSSRGTLALRKAEDQAVLLWTGCHVDYQGFDAENHLCVSVFQLSETINSTRSFFLRISPLGVIQDSFSAIAEGELIIGSILTDQESGSVMMFRLMNRTETDNQLYETTNKTVKCIEEKDPEFDVQSFELELLQKECSFKIKKWPSLLKKQQQILLLVWGEKSELLLGRFTRIKDPLFEKSTLKLKNFILGKQIRNVSVANSPFQNESTPFYWVSTTCPKNTHQKYLELRRITL